MSFGNTWTFLSWRYTLFVLTWQYPVAFWNRTSHYMVMQPAPVSNPFGTLPAMPQMSIGNGGSCSSVQYGILSLPVSFSPLHFLIVFIEQVGDSKMVVVHWECLVRRVDCNILLVCRLLRSLFRLEHCPWQFLGIYYKEGSNFCQENVIQYQMAR